MIKTYKGQTAKKATTNEPLPAGGYVATIAGARVENYDWGDVLVIAFDISEGEYANFFQRKFENDTSTDKKWKGTYRINIPEESNQYFESQQKAFNNLIYSLEDSNPNYHYDCNEQLLKSKSIGVIYRNKEWEYKGKTGWTTECCTVTDVESIRSGDFKIWKDKPLASHSTNTQSNNMETIVETDDLPF